VAGVPGLRRISLDTPLRLIAQPLFSTAVAVELAVARVVDALSARPASDDQTLVDEKLTVLIKTFERPRCAARLVASIRRHFPGVRVVVVDDSTQPVQLQGVTVVPMPFNVGVSAGRNEGLRHVATEFVLLADDDYVFYRGTNLSAALRLMERFPAIDIMGGDELNLPLVTRTNYETGFYREGNLLPTGASHLHPPGTKIGGLTVREKVPNFFLARTDRLRQVPWDPALRLMEHRDFFTRAVGVLTTVSNPDLRCLHAQTPFARNYMHFRMDLAASEAALSAKYARQ
jgi:glycosyltransferase involved in cell wall biosynthesis